MPELDPEGQEDFFRQFVQSARESGRYVGVGGIAKFHRKLRSSMGKICVPRPWVMKLMIKFFQHRLRKAERLLAAASIAPSGDVADLVERVERLRFAGHYGRAGNAQQRRNCLDLLAHYRVAPLDAPFLVWARAIGMNSKTASFGHWDWIVGACMLPIISLLFLAALEVALNPKLSLEVKLIFTPLYFLMGCGAFDFYKSVTFDLFRVGLRYFKPDGWRYTPLPR